MPNRIAYLPLNTYPEVAPDPAILAALGFADSLGCALHVSTFAVDVPQTASPISGFIINVEGLARATEDRSKSECERLEALINLKGKAVVDAWKDALAKGDVSSVVNSLPMAILISLRFLSQRNTPYMASAGINNL